MTRTLFVDLDDTLLDPGPLSRFYWRLAKWFQRRGRAGQRVNPATRDMLANYDRIVLVSSRDVSDADDSVHQLERQGIHVAEVRFCPRKELFRSWKENLVDELAGDGSVDWLDDLFDGQGPVTILRKKRPGEIRGIPVPRGDSGHGRRESEPPSL